VSNPSYDPNLFVDGISSKDYNTLLNDPNKPLINRTTQGVYPPASTVKPYISVSALTTGVINKNTSLFDPGWWQLPGSDKRYRDWKHWGHGRLNVTKALEESADTFFYQVAYDMGIDRLSEWMGKFGYGQYSGIDLSEERSGNMPNRDWKFKRFKKPWYQGDTIPVGIGQGYWTATPIQIMKAMTTLINDGNVKTPHLLLSTKVDGQQVPYKQQETTQIGDIHSGYWEIAKDGMYGVANRPNGTARKYFADAPYKAAAKSGTAQVYGLKANEIYNAHKIAEHLRDHKLMTSFAPYDKPTVAVAVVLENGGAGPAVGTISRQILDHILLGDNTTQLPADAPAPPGTEGD
jgi:penicillin-binding protein 2